MPTSYNTGNNFFGNPIYFWTYIVSELIFRAESEIDIHFPLSRLVFAEYDPPCYITILHMVVGSLPSAFQMELIMNLKLSVL